MMWEDFWPFWGLGNNQKNEKNLTYDSYFWYMFLFFKCMTFYFLTIQVVIILELEQALKDFSDLEICRALNKLLDQNERKHMGEKER